MKKMPKVVILCGGQGTRIREASEFLPKPMLPIGGKPIAWHIMKTYATYGFDEFVLCVGYKGWSIKEYFLNYTAMTADITVKLGNPGAVAVHGHSEEEWTVTVAETGELTATGGRVSAIRHYVESDDLFMLTYGDGVADVDIAALLAFHQQHKPVVTVTAVRPPGRFGELAMSNHRVFEFNEKPQATAGFINGGYFVCDAKRIWDYLPGGPSDILEREPMRRVAADGQLMAYQHTGFWQPMDTPREYALLNELWDRGQAPWRRW